MAAQAMREGRVHAAITPADRIPANGDAISVENRDPREITHALGRQTGPDGIDVYNPAFDITPARLITAITCERGLIRQVPREAIIEKVSTGQRPVSLVSQV